MVQSQKNKFFIGCILWRRFGTGFFFLYLLVFIDFGRDEITPTDEFLYLIVLSGSRILDTVFNLPLFAQLIELVGGYITLPFLCLRECLIQQNRKAQRDFFRKRGIAAAVKHADRGGACRVNSRTQRAKKPARPRKF